LEFITEGRRIQKMTREEYEAYAQKTENWMPGREAIVDCLKKLYKDQKARHYEMADIVIDGQDQHLDRISIYQSENGYKHLVTNGMSQIYPDIDAFAGEFSGWGYEMTMKLPEESFEECLWAVDALLILAAHTNTTGKYLNPLQFISGGKKSIRAGYRSKLTALLAVEDTELKGCMTLHGQLDFIQMVGITKYELYAIAQDARKKKLLIERMKEDNPFLTIDIDRRHEYL